jgi:CHASE3 domain sensor protein
VLTKARRFDLIAVIVAIALLAFVEILGERSTTSFLETARGVAHTREVIEQLDALLVAHLDASAGRRGYALTGDEA